MSGAARRFQRLHAELRARICLLDYPPGTLLSETALAQEFGTSRTPLRRVLARLEDEGLVESRHGVGTLVTDVEIGEMAQVYALRLELAQLAGTLDPLPVTPEMLDEVERFASRGETLLAAPEPRGFAQLNMEYHSFGLSLTGNAALREMTERLYFRTARIWLKSIPHMDLADECAIFLSEMRETQTALRAGDTQAAALIRRAHISMSVRRMS
ncbi:MULTISPECIES: GntR family transcriptional regulator [Rhodobacterales]|uniref:GntR family transcriptional regulator n=1 Tax=Rhodobacterales TaxID=204455 RepID=UPI00405943DA